MIDEINTVLAGISQPVERYVISDIRNELLEKLQELGWSNKVFLDRVSKISITGVRNKIGLCVQTGNVSRVYADLMKLQALFMEDDIKGGILILPTAECGKQYASNAASMERLNRELEIFKQVITMPLVVIGFEE
jgi:hypothetical protein